MDFIKIKSSALWKTMLRELEDKFPLGENIYKRHIW